MGVEFKRAAGGASRGTRVTLRVVRTLGAIVALNALPLGAAAWYLVLASRGEATMRPLPRGSGGLLALALGALVAVVLLAWCAYPALSAALRRVRAARSRAEAAGGARALLAWPLALVAGFLWVDAALLGATVLALAGAEVLLIVRFAAAVRGG